MKPLTSALRKPLLFTGAVVCITASALLAQFGPAEFWGGTYTDIQRAGLIILMAGLGALALLRLIGLPGASRI
ncbi:MAG TPA: hypothetical protein VN701_02165 [Candidatus Paceibacterota bacterium]|nr:hypothetical protein [Candidatus Paceibacterota bacterium]